MGDLADSPLPHRKRPHILLWAAMGLTVILLGSVAWGTPIHFDTVQETLDVQGEFLGYTRVTEGAFVIPKGQPLVYKITVKNVGNRTVPDVHIQSSLHSDGAACKERTLSPGSLLPGNAIAPEQPYVISPGNAGEFEAIYDTNDLDCATRGHIRVRVQYPVSGRPHAVTLISPIRFRVE